MSNLTGKSEPHASTLPPTNQTPYCFTVRTGLGGYKQILFLKYNGCNFFFSFFFDSTGKVNMGGKFRCSSKPFTHWIHPKQIKKQNKKINYPINPNDGCALSSLIKTLTVLWALSEQFPIVHVSTDPWTWCDRFYNLNFSCISKKSLRSRVEMTLFTLVFTCSSEAESWNCSQKSCPI